MLIKMTACNFIILRKNHIMKLKFCLLIAIAVLLYSGCFSKDVKEKSLERPVFNLQKTYILKQFPVEFITHYNVWKNVPLNPMDYPDAKAMLEDRYFTARKKMTIDSSQFIVRDLVNNKRYDMAESEKIKNEEKLISYRINQGKNSICAIDQTDKGDIFNFEISYNNKNYILTGEKKQLNDNIYSFVYSVKNADIVLGTVFKEFRYFSNEYEIIINREYKDIEDPVFICIGIMIDQLLKENGYRFKGE